MGKANPPISVAGVRQGQVLSTPSPMVRAALADVKRAAGLVVHQFEMWALRQFDKLPG